jgi:hypothetical protein
VEERGAVGGRLHRRDTPHHLKNKRVNQIDAGRARDLIAQVQHAHEFLHYYFWSFSIIDTDMIVSIFILIIFCNCLVLLF